MQNYDSYKIKYFANGPTEILSFYLNGQYHRTNGPAIIEYYASGKVQMETYYLNGKAHRIEGPAQISYYQSRKICREAYYLNNKLHRTNGPAVIEYDKMGKLKSETYFFDGSSIAIGSFVDVVRKSKDKTQAFIRVMNEVNDFFQADKLRKTLVGILPSMFETEIDENVINNVSMFF